MFGNAAHLRLCLLVLPGAFCSMSCFSAIVESSVNRAAEIRYVDDVGGDYWQSPAETVRRGAGDCEDQAIYLQHLLRRRGIRSEVVFGIEDLREVKHGHVWVECPAHGEVYVLDPTKPLMRIRRKLERYQYYPALDQPIIEKKVRTYLERTGESGLNAHYEARIRNRKRREGSESKQR